MSHQSHNVPAVLRHCFNAVFWGPQVLAFLPAIILAGFWLGGEGWLTVMAIGSPLLLLSYFFMRPVKSRRKAKQQELAASQHTAFVAATSAALKQAHKNNRKTACFIIGPDDLDMMIERHGQSSIREVMTQLAARLHATLRSGDCVTVLGETRLGVVMAPVDHLNLDIALDLAGRLQIAVEKPVTIDGMGVYFSASVGFCQDATLQGRSGRAMVNAAELALTVARRNGPSSIRVYSPDMRDAKLNLSLRSNDIETALERGQIVPWFQPQISTDTGHVTGFEALARWQHPKRGILGPADFLPRLQKNGQMERLGEIMLGQALDALKIWDRQGLGIPRVAVNFSPDELRNPQLIAKIAWELDRLDFSADRLAIEILETVVATSADDMVARNISGLAELGCQIDLDDFGTGHSSISSIRRFDIQRLKIDRSFVTNVDRDPEQQRMVAAILLMAEQLNLDTLAEGVETAGEHAMLAQLGCRHVQGFGIGRPMPLEMTQDWIAKHVAKLSNGPEVSSGTG